MTLAKYEVPAIPSSARRIDAHRTSISEIPAPKFQLENTSTVKIGSVKVRFTQNYKKNEFATTTTTTTTVVVPPRVAAKRVEDEELKCCGVPWPPSRIPLAAYSNYRNTSRIGGGSCGDGGVISRSSRYNRCGNDDVDDDDYDERRNFTTTSSSPVRRCTSECSQHVHDAVRPALVDCFGKRNNSLKFCATKGTAPAAVVRVEQRLNEERVPCAVRGGNRRRHRGCCCDCDTSYAYECVVNDDSRDSSFRLSIYDRDTRRRDLITPSTSSSGDGNSTLDHFQKFRFGGDRNGRNGGGRRGSGGSGHKKKGSSSRSSDKTINLKKLTDKLKQGAANLAHDDIEDDGGTVLQPSPNTRTYSLPPPPPPPLPPPPLPPSPKPVQVLIPLKNDDDNNNNVDDESVAACDKDADLFEAVNLKLTKPESRTIVGSYYQRSIPFRSASFSQVHYLPEDRKYIRNNARKLGSLKRANLCPADNAAATLPRVNASNTSIASVAVDENADDVKTSSDPLPQFFYTFAVGNDAVRLKDYVPDATNVQPEQHETVVPPDVESTCAPLPQNVCENDVVDAAHRLSYIESQPAEPLTASVIPIMAPATADVTAGDDDNNAAATAVKKFATPPMRSRHSKHKHHRHRPCGRLYFSDENIFSSGAEYEHSVDGGRPRVESVENLFVNVNTTPSSDGELVADKQPSTVIEINFIDDLGDKNVVECDRRVQTDQNVPAPIVDDLSKCANDEDEIKSGADASTSSSMDDGHGVAAAVVASTPTDRPLQKLTVDVNAATQSLAELEHVHFYQTPSSPEDCSLRPQWPPFRARSRKLTPQTSTEKEDEPEPSYTSRRHHLFSQGDSFSEADSDAGDKRSISPATKDGRLSPLPNSGHELSDSDSRSATPRKNFASSPSVPYSKRPLRGPYLEMIVNEQKKPESIKSAFSKLLEGRGRHSNNDRAVIDDYYLRRSNTSPPSSVKPSNLSASSSATIAGSSSLPKRKISANIPFCGPTSLRAAPEEKTLVHHQRTTSSPSQLEYYPDQLSAKGHHGPVPNQQLLHQLLRGSSEHCLVQDVDLLKKIYPTTTYKDTRSHIVVELYDTERSYVESLQILVTKYLQPLKSPECSNLIDAYVVEEIFYKIPEILAYHEIFLEELRIRLDGWNKSKCIGDIFLETFTKPAVIDSYIAYINNRKTANESIKQIAQTKPAFVRFTDAMAREHKGKLTLDSLLIMPVQRIPRYELLIQSLLKHTEICHPDYDKLQEALRQVHELALRINCTERDSLELEQIENLIDGLANLVTGDRTFLRYDLVSMTSGQGPSRKERALFLFNDLLIITSVKRRSSTVKKAVLSSPASIASSLEANKYKLLMKIPLEHLDIVKVKDENLRRMMREMEYLTDDVNTLSQMVDLVATLHCPHGQIEENIREMLSALNKQLNDRHVSESQLSFLELALNTRNSVENISVIFPKPEKRTNWEETFLEAKTRLNVSGDRRLNPEFLTSVPIRKTRAGLQFTCAAASYNQQDVWVCNSDGYVGQVCILSLNPEPAVTSCNGVCNARILSVTSVPVSRCIEKCQDGQDNLGSSTNASPASGSLPKSEPFDEISESIPVENLERDVSDICLDSSSSSDEDDDEEPVEEPKTIESPSVENVDSTMWLGTEDGVVHIYNCADSLRIKRNRLKIQHNSAVYCILYVEKSVFVSLANGEVYMYNWCLNFGWNTTEPTVIPVGCVTSPVSRMFLVCGKLWCICHNIIKTLNIHTLQVENSFSIIGENNRAITSVAVSGFSVYLSLQNSAVLRVIHGISCEILAEVNIAPAVTKMLSGVDDIIRQHKAACLRVTSLLACKELLWIGTSAGVILTMPLPNVKQDTPKITNISHPIGLPHGHTGHVRFLTAVKYKGKKKDTSGRRSSKILDRKPDLSNVNKMLIISGGDGYEDFRSSSVSEIAGREDSTNHLLIWRF